MQWSRIPGGEKLVRWFAGTPVCFHDGEISDIWLGGSTNAGDRLEKFATGWRQGAEHGASRCVVAVYLYRFGDGRREAVVELDFQNVRSFELAGDYPQQMVLDEIALEEKGDSIRVAFFGITGFGGHVEAAGLTVRVRDVQEPRG